MRSLVLTASVALTVLAAQPAAAQGTADSSDVAQHARAVLDHPGAAAPWFALAGALRTQRPAQWNDIPTAAERQALRIAESIAQSSAGALQELRITSGGGRTELWLDVDPDAVRARLRTVPGPEPALMLTLEGATPALLADRFPNLHRGAIRALDVVSARTGTVHVRIALAESVAHRLERSGDELVIRFDDSARFLAWSSTPAWARGEPQLWRPSDSGDEDAADFAGMAAEQTREILAVVKRLPPPPRDGVLAVAALVLLGTLVGLRRRPAAPPKRRWRRRRVRLTTARSLVASGAPQAEIARRTGLARDALVLLSRAASTPDRNPAASAGRGSIFRLPDDAGLLGGRRAVMG